jgi:hypothetical protein
MSMLAGCGAQDETPRQIAIDFTLLQPAEMPLGWYYDWKITHEEQCEGRWTFFTYDIGSPNVTHIIWDCPTEDAAKAIVYQQSSPDLKASRDHIGGDSKPAHADQYLAYCDIPQYKILIGPDQEASIEHCTTLARYGRVVSMMMVNAIRPTAKWPLEADLLKWTIERNDAKMVKLAQ